jgi:pyrroline-5-carboxylate reductase
MLDQLTIGLIGHGHLGTHIERQLNLQNVRVHTSKGAREDRADINAKIAEEADLLLLTIRPTQMNEVIAQIRKSLRSTTPVISLAAAYPLADLQAALDAPVSRGMVDIEGMGGILYQGDSLERATMNSLSRFTTLLTGKEEDIEDFTVGSACLPGKAAWQFDKNAGGADEWLALYVQFLTQEKGLKSGINKGIIEAVKQEGNYAQKVIDVATGKGITARMIAELEKDPNAAFERIYSAGRQRIQEIAAEATKR